MTVSTSSLRFVSFATVLLIAGVLGCDKPPPSAVQAPAAPKVETHVIKKLPVTEVDLAGRPFQLEVARSTPEQELGLMYRESMGANEGMIFVFADEQQRNFYMKNTLIPLDIAYLDRNGVVLNVPKMYPRDLTSIPSRGRAMYAIELNQGTADTIGLKPGDRVTLPASLR